MKIYINSSTQPSDLTYERLQGIVEIIMSIMHNSGFDDATRCIKINEVLRYYDLEE